MDFVRSGVRLIPFVSSVLGCKVAIPHRLFMSWFRPASLTACPPREPPPLFEQEHRKAKEPTSSGRYERELSLERTCCADGGRMCLNGASLENYGDCQAWRVCKKREIESLRASGWGWLYDVSMSISVFCWRMPFLKFSLPSILK